MLINAKTVLKGEDSESRISFFKVNGSGNLNPRRNPVAYLSWLLRLEKASLTDSQPIKWIRQMLEECPLQRVTALGLLGQIHEYHDHDRDLIYYGHCCAEEVSDLSSICQSSITENIGETATPPRDRSSGVAQRKADEQNAKVTPSRAQRISHAIQDVNVQMARTRDTNGPAMRQKLFEIPPPTITCTTTSLATTTQNPHRNRQVSKLLQDTPTSTTSRKGGSSPAVYVSRDSPTLSAHTGNLDDWMDCSSSEGDENVDPLQTPLSPSSSKQSVLATKKLVLQDCEPNEKMIPVTKKWKQLNLGRSLPPKAVRRNFEDTSASENETDDGGIPATAGPQAEQEDPNHQGAGSQPTDVPELRTADHSHGGSGSSMNKPFDDPVEASQSKHITSIEEPAPDLQLAILTNNAQYNSIRSTGNLTAHNSRSEQRGPALAVVTEFKEITGGWNYRLDTRLRRIRRYITETEERTTSPRLTNPSSRSRIYEWKHSLEIGEKPFAFLGRNCSPDTLGKWIHDASLRHFGPSAREQRLAKELWVTIVKFSCFFVVAGTCSLDQLPLKRRGALVEFGRCARRIRRRFQRLLTEFEGFLSDQEPKDLRDDTHLPRKDPNNEAAFLKAIFRSSRQEEVVSAMCEWCVKFEEEWMTAVLQNQARNSVNTSQPRLVLSFSCPLKAIFTDIFT
jgi:hypothetical protein